jgi:hypothetical protein
MLLADLTRALLRDAESRFFFAVVCPLLCVAVPLAACLGD